MDAFELVATRNTDAAEWAKSFCETFPDCNVDEGTMISWFANAIMTMHDKLLYGNAPLNGDHAQFLIDREKDQ